MTTTTNNNEVFAAVEGETDAISGPMVFSCIKCHVIVGDSFSYLKSSADMNTLTLSGASHVSRSADVYTSKSGPDVGSTYFRFNCSSCQAALGRYYLTTSKDLDDLREKFTFTVDSLESYELGKAQHGKVPEIMTENVLSGTTGCSSSSSGGGDDGQGGDDGNNEYAPTGIGSEVLKIQHVMFDLLERMMRQEQSTQRTYYPPIPYSLHFTIPSSLDLPHFLFP